MGTKDDFLKTSSFVKNDSVLSHANNYSNINLNQNFENKFEKFKNVSSNPIKHFKNNNGKTLLL